MDRDIPMLLLRLLSFIYIVNFHAKSQKEVRENVLRKTRTKTPEFGVYAVMGGNAGLACLMLFGRKNEWEMDVCRVS